ncbi:sulfotransferase family 2 domain-containing protein [Sessilibacter corallicola]|uniref:sulfotransferase family 2 domain-containing protein n=1 Tax=Sessilibacter corallicola TaxID=2904075 RepID=UPI001E3A6946|nr:sulfotransferase family 2 domain-containing protein [Sessilibacter corallicola]MCE2026810.1 sulfotransferase family 2 domain-containing protein [Sessilibacter corallicola]
MLITDDFVFVHMPKTGGTFVQNMLQKIYPNATTLETHLTCSDIPQQAQELPVLSIIRHPMDRYVSQFHFGWWRMHPERYCSQAQWNAMGIDPKNLSFRDFIRISDAYFKGYFSGEKNGFENHKTASPLGWHTEQFIRFYYRNPKQVFSDLDERKIQTGDYKESEFPVTFLHTESLNQDLVAYLTKIGRDEEDIAFILDQGKLQPKEGTKRTEEDDWQSYFDPDITRFVCERERLLFNRFPSYQEELPKRVIKNT